MKCSSTTVRLKDGRLVELRSPDGRGAATTLAFVRQLSRESFRNLNHPPSFFDTMTIEAQAAFLDAICSSPRNFMICAWEGGAVIGSTPLSVLGASFSSHAGELGLGVLEAYRQLGLGRLLTQKLI